MKRVLLVDNGSLEPASTLQLRRLAAGLAERVGSDVVPVSLAHSASVPPEALEGRPAELFEPALDRVLREAADEIVVVPLFVGPSHAIVRHVPAVIAEREKVFPGARIELASPLFIAGETRLAQILADHVTDQFASLAPDGIRRARPRVAVVDHGSPSRPVTEVRDRVTAQLRFILDAQVTEVVACSMERRPGSEFKFNEPLLENLLLRDGWRDGPVIVALLFIAPGKHAGPEGDVAQIVARTRADDGEEVRFTPVLGAHPLLVEILADRVKG